MVAMQDIPDVTRLHAELERNNNALAILQGEPPGMITAMMVAPGPGSEEAIVPTMLDTSEMPGQEAYVSLMIDIINWRQYLIKEALQGLGVDVDPASPAEAAAYNAHQQTQRQRKR
jgi:hypothetical protein